MDPTYKKKVHRLFMVIGSFGPFGTPFVLYTLALDRVSGP